uniref:Glycosyltransferase n=1 Tax=Candidatus Kentrum eta TaxID=2126337 RepID=A0A450ULV5_9GAMM|nr:MAG: hypothetical protein BECKH772A_GA0070896_1005716 [Candidatus Kentron sp. H]VFJ94311.1 MAG: hypothetical protein BECKH772B_GA0070898_1005915 [Candidatus Kentron sp. H]VFK00943.1 MAG: hypothetical protein BECKH772C_GA0070978_1005516 [Candidatus Kentron sp. H]
MKRKHARILVFAKAPVPGAVKTRLIPALGPRRAAALQARLIRHTLTTVARSGLAWELWCHPHREHPLLAACLRRACHAGHTPPGNPGHPPPGAPTLHTQVGRDLGARMAHGARTGLAGGPVILIGTDCPTLTAADLTRASAALEGGHDAVLGPALDGGYYLLGLNRIHPSLFRDMAWGSDRVLAETRRRLEALGWRWWALPPRRDMDRPADLAFLGAAMPSMKRFPIPSPVAPSPAFGSKP